MDISVLDTDESALNLAKEDLMSGGFHPAMIKLIECKDLTKINDETINKNDDNDNKVYDTVALNLVLQDIARPMRDKFPKILNGLSTYIDENSTLFGSTITNISEDGYTTFTKNYMRALQNTRYIQNTYDSIKIVDQIMDEFFDNYDIREIGYGITFQGTKFKKSKIIGSAVDFDVDDKPKKMEKFI